MGLFDDRSFYDKKYEEYYKDLEKYFLDSQAEKLATLLAQQASKINELEELVEELYRSNRVYA